MENNRNYFIAIALSVLIVLAWQFFYMNPRLEAQRQVEQAAKLQQQAQTAQSTAGGATAPSGQTPNAESRDEAVANSPRVVIDTQALIGSIRLAGARLDDLKLKAYHETVDKSSPIITLFSPGDTKDGYFTEFGYVGDASIGTLPGPSTVWTLASGDKLTEKTPVTLTYTNDKGIVFSRVISVDDRYMFTITDKITNSSQAPVALSSYGRLTRNSKPVTPSTWLQHEGFLGLLGASNASNLSLGNGVTQEKYTAVDEKPFTKEGAVGGWFGITDKYWAAAIVPPASVTYDASFAHFADGVPRYQAAFQGTPLTVAPGESVELRSLVFAGAKEVPVISGYETSYSIPLFDRMIDWGWLYFITKPLFSLMDFFYRWIGNFGVAILCTTLVLKTLFLPLASKQYASMANMKRMQPKMEELKAKFGDDKMGLQQATMQLYKEEKINPIAGCWPVLLTIPVFFSLYKVISITIEMRHAPFYGWIQDLSAPDPTSIVNLFGLLPFTAPAIVHLGVWPIIMGFTMFLQMRMNPTPPDPTQAMIFTWMPLVFTFFMASLPAGIVIYYCLNNSLSVTQQSIFMKRHGVKVELFGNLKGIFRRKTAPSK